MSHREEPKSLVGSIGDNIRDRIKNSVRHFQGPNEQLLDTDLRSDFLYSIL